MPVARREIVVVQAGWEGLLTCSSFVLDSEESLIESVLLPGGLLRPTSFWMESLYDGSLMRMEINELFEVGVLDCGLSLSCWNLSCRECQS